MEQGQPIGIHVAQKLVGFRVGGAQRPGKIVAGDGLLNFGRDAVLAAAPAIGLMAKRLLDGNDINVVALAEGHEFRDIGRGKAVIGRNVRVLRILKGVFHVKIELVVFEVRQALDKALERPELHDLAARVVLRAADTACPASR